MQGQLDGIYTQTLSHTSYLRKATNTEMQELLDKHKVNIMKERDDGLEELEKGGTDVLEDHREKAEDISERAREQVEEHAVHVYHDVREKLDALEEEKVRLDREKADLRRKRGWLAWEREVLARKTRRRGERTSGGGRDNKRNRDGKAASAPL
jgi:hypothetical protein